MLHPPKNPNNFFFTLAICQTSVFAGGSGVAVSVWSTCLGSVLLFTAFWYALWSRTLIYPSAVSDWLRCIVDVSSWSMFRVNVWHSNRKWNFLKMCISYFQAGDFNCYVSSLEGTPIRIPKHRAPNHQFGPGESSKAHPRSLLRELRLSPGLRVGKAIFFNLGYLLVFFFGK